MRLDLTAFDALTFDCYGTLIDWQSGIGAAMLPLLERIGEPAQAEWIMRRFGEIERAKQAGAYRSYREVLRDVSRELLGGDGDGRASETDLDALSESIRDWPAFDDTIDALRALRERYTLAIVSNIDREIFEDGTLPRLGVPFDVVVTAEDVRSYKPGHAHFHEASRRLGVGFDRILHVAESRFHDIEPANALGIASVHVDRAGGGSSASGAGAGNPDLTVGSMRELAEMVERAFEGS